VPFFYQTGEEIKVGDRVLIHAEPGEIEVVADPLDDPNGWHAKDCGGGVMIVEPKVFGRLFLPAPVSQYDDLVFVSRGGPL
jgi:hypothetical protein